MDWISIDDKSPENYSFVLATIQSPIDKWVEIVGFCNGVYELPARGRTDFVTHWMPIPKPAL